MRLGHLEMLPELAFRTVGKRLSTLEGGGGKGGSAPKAPDYQKLAQQQAELQSQLIDKTTRANRVNQVTPFGNLTFTRAPDVFDEAGYNAALQDYNAQMASFNKPQSYVMPDNWGGGGLGSRTQQMPVRPSRQNFMKSNSDDWTATTTLSPEMQGIFNENVAAKNRAYNELQTSLGNSPINAGETAQEAILRRVNPQLDIQENQLRQRLINQGLRPGSQAWNRELELMGQNRNDAYSQAALQGIDTQFRANAMPLNLINSYLGGSQVTMPQFQNYAQQANQQAPDILGAAQSQYSDALNAYNASQARGSNLMGGLFSLGGSLLSGGGGLGGALGSALYPSGLSIYGR